MKMKVPVAVIDVSKLDFLHASSGNCLIHLSRTTEWMPLTNATTVQIIWRGFDIKLVCFNCGRYGHRQELCPAKENHNHDEETVILTDEGTVVIGERQNRKEELISLSSISPSGISTSSRRSVPREERLLRRSSPSTTSTIKKIRVHLLAKKELERQKTLPFLNL